MDRGKAFSDILPEHYCTQLYLTKNGRGGGQNYVVVLDEKF